MGKADDKQGDAEKRTSKAVEKIAASTGKSVDEVADAARELNRP